MTNGRILIVESNAIVAWDLSESLELAGYEVCCASGGAEALREARGFRPEAAVVDFDDAKGPLDPASLGHLLHEEYRSSVVYFTALTQAERPAWLAAVLPLAFLGKPVDPSKLRAKAAEAIAIHRGRLRVSRSMVPAKLGAGCLCSPDRGASLVPLTQ